MILSVEKSARMLVLLVAALSVLLFSSGVGAATAQTRANPDIRVTVAGQQHRVRVGDKVQLPTHPKQNGCATDQVTISITPPTGTRSAAVSGSITDRCELLIENVDTSSEASLPPSDTDGAHQQVSPSQVSQGKEPQIGSSLISAQAARTGWGKFIYREQFHVAVTSVYARMSYTDDGRQVFGGNSPFPECWWRWETGWRNARCVSFWSPNGPAEVWIKTEGDFTHLDPIYNHTSMVTFRGRPAAVWQIDCGFNGWKPALWHWDCVGGLN